jgi:xylitol oxidase
MRQYVYENLPLAQLEAHFDAIFSAAYSVSLFLDWQTDRVNQVWVKSRVMQDAAAMPEGDFFGAAPATADLHPLPTLPAAPCTPQMGVVGPWHERLPHFRMEFTPSSGEELQSEYFVPRAHAVAAMRAIFGLRAQLAPVLQMSEIRTIAADDLWMSPFYGRDSVALHFTWRTDWDGVQALLPLMETELAPFAPAPHWGKLFTMPAPAVQARYAKLPQFQQLLHSYDPAGKFRNSFLDTALFDTP